ncbi:MULTISPECIES: hypothetical protein [Bacillus cereus group]|nr:MULTISPECIES: hypothetical protein [Bacillus cereus group]MDA2614702.1 hypothetical protein [Bacillus cereus]MEB8821756.1 hypothetical protein [Bacillus cereus]MEB8975331.1 hypothetical protein [Bacillus cereus]MEB9135979.1 hypothetical protein [Bacillus cereus]MEB9509920.1 hypothetical protein [Bacillus cereus]
MGSQIVHNGYVAKSLIPYLMKFAKDYDKPLKIQAESCKKFELAKFQILI